MEEIIYPILYGNLVYSRNLLSQEDTVKSSVPKWKESLWDNNSVEPAMLRVPIVILTFVFLWGINIFIFDRFKLQYHTVMSIKSGDLDN